MCDKQVCVSVWIYSCVHVSICLLISVHVCIEMSHLRKWKRSKCGINTLSAPWSGVTLIYRSLCSILWLKRTDQSPDIFTQEMSFGFQYWWLTNMFTQIHCDWSRCSQVSHEVTTQERKTSISLPRKWFDFSARHCMDSESTEGIAGYPQASHSILLFLTMKICGTKCWMKKGKLAIALKGT